MSASPTAQVLSLVDLSWDRRRKPPTPESCPLIPRLPQVHFSVYPPPVSAIILKISVITAKELRGESLIASRAQLTWKGNLSSRANLDATFTCDRGAKVGTINRSVKVLKEHILTFDFYLKSPFIHSIRAILGLTTRTACLVSCKSSRAECSSTRYLE